MSKTTTLNWIIALTVAAVYLCVSIAFDCWAYSWIIWAAYAVYRFLVK